MQFVTYVILTPVVKKKKKRFLQAKLQKNMLLWSVKNVTAFKKILQIPWFKTSLFNKQEVLWNIQEERHLHCSLNS